MKKVISLALVAGVASAFAQVPYTEVLKAKTMSYDGSPSVAMTSTPVFSAISSPYVAFAARGGSLGFDDYIASPNAAFPLTEMRFVGGVTAIGGQLRFDFFDNSNTPVGAFVSTFGTAGNFIWSITGLGGLGINLPGSGRMQITALGATTGQWFLSTTAPTLGSSTPYGSLATHNHRFELSTVPEPGSAIALVAGLGALVLRRKKA